MPLCHAYIPPDALDREAERQLVARVTNILVDHEMRRITDLEDDASAVEANRQRAMSIAWTFVHRSELYVAGVPITAPYYLFSASVPEGQLDDVFVPAINRDIMQAVIDAEAGKWPAPHRRVWITAGEIPDGMWGAGGRQLHLKQIVDVVAPGWGDMAEARWALTQRDAAAALVRLADGHEAQT